MTKLLFVISWMLLQTKILAEQNSHRNDVVRNDDETNLLQARRENHGMSQCATSEQWVTCVFCEPSCANPNPNCPGTTECQQGCQCKKGFARNAKGECKRAKNKACVKERTTTPTTTSASETVWQCTICNNVYLPETQSAPAAAGTPFEDLPDSWICPVCGNPKSKYEEVTVTTASPTTASPTTASPTTAATSASDINWQCQVCGNLYLPDSQSGSAPAGTPFEELPDDWVCPVCGNPKSRYAKVTDVPDYRLEIKRMVRDYKVIRPVRSFMDDEDYTWRNGQAPNYDVADYYYLLEKTMNHSADSIEIVVENLVKTWEFERSNKLDLSQHKAIDQSSDCAWNIQANDNQVFCSTQAHELGNYNVLLDGVPDKYWPQNLNWEQSHDKVRDAWRYFAWEVLQVFTGPPTVSFSWRHWAKFTGHFNGVQGQGRLQEMYGFATATVSPDLKLREVKIYYKPVEFFQALVGERDYRDNYYAGAITGSMSYCSTIEATEKGGDCVYGHMRADDFILEHSR